VIAVVGALGCALAALGTAAGQPRPRVPVRPPVAPIAPATAAAPVTKMVPGRPAMTPRKPIVVPPRAPVRKLPKLPTARGTQTRTVELVDTSGKRKFSVTLTAPRAVDARALDYLQQTLRIVELSPADRKDQAAWQKHAGPGRPGADVMVVITPHDAVNAGDFAALPPDGVDVIRPGVLRVRDDFLDGLARRPAYRFLRPRPPTPRPPPPPPGPPAPREGLAGILTCRSADGTATMERPLPFVKIMVGERETSSDVNGVFTVPGSYAAGRFTLEVTYDAPVATSGVTTPLRVMDEVQNARGESVTRTATIVDGQASVAGVVLTSVDCEIWRLGVELLTDFHALTGRTTPARSLRIKRWSAVWGAAVHTYYDYLVVGTDFGTDDRYRVLAERRGTLFHELGHSLRHVIDGDEFHWAWDNFRWAYARGHSGCETWNVQYVFNEGWAGYWANERIGHGIPDCGKDPPFVDWTEAMIALRLRELARALSATDSGVRSRKMLEVLERNPGAIHTLREYELRYCALHAAGNAQCIDASTPRRDQPASCPPGWIDDGATCRLDNIRGKAFYLRGGGTVPSGCAGGQENDAGLCYPRCPSGFHGRGPMCWQDCPSGFRDDGAYCAKPEAYGRGGGYPWEFGDPAFDLGNARRRCEAANPAGCEQDGLIFYPRCRAGFHAFACCVCTPDCPAGMTDIGVSCQKQSTWRAVGTVPTVCAAGEEYDTGLCYPQCRAGFVGVGPGCWERGCPDGFADHGATCYREPAIIVKY
jgi:hypothetical protein